MNNYDNILDLSHLHIYVIDPENCSDADDAFNITTDINKEDDAKTNTTLWIFIADPTREFTYSEFMNGDILKKRITKYYINKDPDHLFPQNIVKKYSLSGGEKYAIGIKVVFDRDYNILSTDIYNVKINIKEHLCYSNTIIDKTLSIALEMSNTLFNRRKGVGKILSEYFLAGIRKKYDDQYELYNIDAKTKKLKNMIAEFAILANSIVAEKIEYKLIRMCEKIENKEIKCPQEFLQNIIANNIKAKYTPCATNKNNNNKHLMIDDKYYTHFTSPLRRASDCLIHYLLKGYDISYNDLKYHTDKINDIVSADKKRQWQETKLYTLLAMNAMPKPIVVNIRMSSVYKQFLNMTMTSINEFPVQISLTIKKPKDFKETDLKKFVLYINQVNLNKKYDSEIFPELYNYIRPVT